MGRPPGPTPIMITNLTRRGSPAMAKLVQRAAYSLRAVSPENGLSEQAKEFLTVAQKISDEELSPHMQQWDKDHYFPKETLKYIASHGFGGIYISEDKGGTGLSRLESSVVFEALSKGCVSTTAYLTIQNMCAWMVSEFGSDDIRERFLAGMMSMDMFA